MRLGKEQAIGVIEETTGTDCLPVDQLHEGDAGDVRQLDGVLTEVPEQGALIR